MISHCALALRIIIVHGPGKEMDKGGKIINQELHTYPTGLLYATQEKAWMSEALMMRWIEEVLKPYVLTAPPGIIPVIFLDSYGVHKMGSVHRAINDCGCEVIIIPPGCTGLTQPVDVGYNKPFKGLVRDKYEEWMVKESEDLSIPPRRVDVARWVAQSEVEMDAQILRNAWMRHDLEYFPRIGDTSIQQPAVQQPELPPHPSIPMLVMVPPLPPLPDVVSDVSSEDDMGDAA
jgi:hypothetical protein